MLNKKLRVLNVEGSEWQVALLTRHLNVAGYQPVCQRVETADAMKAALAAKEWDIILCDYSMPHFNALAALDVLRQSGLDIPFIIISGTVGEEGAVKAMLTGANDYLPKDNLTRLGPAIGRELQAAENRRLQRRTEETRRLTEERYRALFEFAADGIIIASPESYYLDANAGMCQMLGYSHTELIGMHASEIVTKAEIEHIDEALDEIKAASDYHREWQFRRKDGSVFVGDVMATTMPDGNLMAIIRDMTDRRQAEVTIERSQKRLTDAQRLTHIGSWEWNLQTNCLEWSEEHYRIFGLSPGDIDLNMEAVVSRCVHDEDVGFFNTVVERARKTLQPFSLDFRVVHPDGSIHMVHSLGSVTADAHGNPRSMHGTAQDVTEAKRSQEALSESEERYRDLIENATDIIYTHDLKGNYTSINKVAETITGYTRDEVLAMNIADSVAPQHLEKARKMIAAKLAGDEVTTYELELIAKDGHTIAIEVNTRIIFKNDVPIGVQGIARDITDRRQSETDLRESEEKFRQLASTVTDVFYLTSPDLTEMHYVSPAYEHIWGRSTESLYANPYQWGEAIPPEERDAVIAAFSGLATGSPKAEIEFRIVRPDGTIRWIHSRGFPVRDADGKVIRITGIASDITERKRAEGALEDSEASFKALFERANDAIFVVDKGIFQTCNPRAEILFGCSRDDIIGHSPAAFSPREQPDGRLSSEMAAEYMASAMRGVPQFFEWKHTRLDGTPFDAEVSLNQVDFRSTTHLQGTVRDITERKELEEQLRQSQKMEAVGVLAGGIAHDFNNLLTAINGYSDLTLRRMPVGDPLRRNIEEVKKAGDRATELTTQLLAFSRKQVLKPVVHNLNSAISNIENMLRRIIRESIELRTILDPELGNIKADPGQIEQVIMNLVVNARDAMPDGGTLTIQTQNIYLDQDYISQHLAVTPGEFVRMTVTDTGEGMDMTTQSHIFEPFFTTKEVGKGTGLGLSTVYGIVKQSGGDVMVYSEPGHGTTFKIYLPCVDEVAQKPKWVGDKVEKHSGTETILLVEDEEIVRNLVREVLVSSGYRVLEAASGKAALSVCDTYSEPIQMLLTDMVMPRMSGNELRDVVVKLHPEIKVLFMSGYTDDANAHCGIFDPHTEFIEKPFTPDGLARKVREVLEY